MSTDWAKAAEETKFEDKPKLELGFKGPVTIVKTLREAKGEELVDTQGNAQLIVIFASDEGAEKLYPHRIG